MQSADEHASICEWLAYHRSIGVGHFYVYDDRSRPPLKVRASPCNFWEENLKGSIRCLGSSKHSLPCLDKASKGRHAGVLRAVALDQML